MTKEIPLSYRNAIQQEQWAAAITQEINAWKRLSVFTLVPRTKNLKALPVLWKFTKKEGREIKSTLSCCWPFGQGKIYKTR